MLDYQRDFIHFALDLGVLKFGQFQLKSGRTSPYFFNTGLFKTGAQLSKLGRFYAQALLAANMTPDVLYGPAYKGIPLACATAIAFSELTGQDIPFAFNRKEAKDHGEGGVIVGSVLTGNVLILDDVITAGTSVRESVSIIQTAGATAYGVLIALDRQELGQDGCSAIDEVKQQFGLQVTAIITLADIIEFLASEDRALVAKITEYQQLYGIKQS